MESSDRKVDLSGRRLRQAVWVGASTATLAANALAGCLNRPLEPVEPRTTLTIAERLTQSAVDKIDLLLVIDNSISMADKQDILRLAVPDLVEQLVNPPCVDEEGTPTGPQPTDPLAECSAGSTREFEPVLDIHVGVVTSSLGGMGGDVCAVDERFNNDDKGRLVLRTVGSDPPLSGWNGKDFLVWDPNTENPTHSPPGTTDMATFIDEVGRMVSGADENGCGFEQTLEGWYRFLIEPDPYDSITVEDDRAILNGTDQVVLQQRAELLRSDSLLAIIMLSDEDDCSQRAGGTFYNMARGGSFRLPKPRAACAESPNDPCCRSCGQPPGEGCSTANDDCDSGPLSMADDSLNQRCFDQKRRFGIDFKYPIERYRNGLTSPQVSDRHGNVVQNPIFSNLDPASDSAVRDPGLVFVAAIVGVPWQDIARQRGDGTPDLLAGLNAKGEPVGGFKSADELALDSTWEMILGDPDADVPPTDPFMIESIDARSGSHPITGDPIVPPGGSPHNAINGAEYSIRCGLPNAPGPPPTCSNDLQYACIFDLPSPLPDGGDCVAGTSAADNPLCDPANPTTQLKAKAYPGPRFLHLNQLVGSQGITASICPEQLTDGGQFNFGYRPAVGAIVERLKRELGGQCLPRSLTPNLEGQVPCIILEAMVADPCSCPEATGRRGPLSLDHPAVKAAREDPAANPAWSCFCEIAQLTGDDLAVCQEAHPDPNTAHGWCYVDSTSVPPIGNPEIVESCPGERRIIRFVGEGQGSPGATLFITCSGEAGG